MDTHHTWTEKRITNTFCQGFLDADEGDAYTREGSA